MQNTRPAAIGGLFIARPSAKIYPIKGAPMPKLIKLYIVNVAYGFALSVIFLGLLLGFDIAGLRHLILGSDMGWVAAFMTIVMNGVVFAGVQFAIAVMRMAEDPDGPTRGTRAPVATRIPALVKTAAKCRENRLYSPHPR